MQAYCSLDPCEQIAVEFQLNDNYISKYRTQNGGHIVSDPILEMERWI